MALKIEPNQSAVAYHITDGATRFRYAIDATHAIASHPLEWRDSPWSPSEAAAARKQLNERLEDEGLATLPEPEPLSPADQEALDEHNRAVEAAAERLAAYRKRKAEEEAEAAQVANDEAILASAPPEVRKPLSPAQIRKRAAMTDDEKLIADKAEADRIGNAINRTI